jgi:hypothetical protein
MLGVLLGTRFGNQFRLVMPREPQWRSNIKGIYCSFSRSRHPYRRAACSSAKPERRAAFTSMADSDPRPPARPEPPGSTITTSCYAITGMMPGPDSQADLPQPVLPPRSDAAQRPGSGDPGFKFAISSLFFKLFQVAAARLGSSSLRRT